MSDQGELFRRTRDTSREAYFKLRDSGVLSERRWEVYELVYLHGPATSAELLERRIRGMRALTQSRARFTELRDMGLLRELEPRTCKVTGHRAIVWEVTDESEPRPIKRDKGPTKAELQERIDRALALPHPDCLHHYEHCDCHVSAIRAILKGES